MGIKDFHKWLNNNLMPYIDNETIKGKIENLYIDINFLLHYCSYNTPPNKLLDKIARTIMRFITEYKPTKRVILAVDGPAPYAKMILQKKRRLNMRIEDMKFTPGTLFFNSDLKDKLDAIKKYIEKTQNIMVVVRHMDPNEAEMKIIGEIIKFPNDKHLIISNDADVIVIVSATMVKGIYVAILQNRTTNIISIDNMIENFVDKYGRNRKYPSMEFAFGSLMMGNDYFPKIYSLTFDKIWKTYDESSCEFFNSVDPIEINVENLNMFMTYLVSDMNKTSMKHLNLNNINLDNVRKYIDGLMWCITNYRYGTCDKYDYIYDRDMIHPLEFLTYILVKKHKFSYPQGKCEPIGITIYPLIVLPEKANKIFDNKHKSKMEKINFLYAEEKCRICKELADNKIQLRKHKKNHKALTLSEIQLVLQILSR